MRARLENRFIGGQATLVIVAVKLGEFAGRDSISGFILSMMNPVLMALDVFDFAVSIDLS